MWTTVSQSHINDEMLHKLYNMYVETYSKAGQTIWFTDPSQLRKYNCSFILNTDSSNTINGFIMYQLYTYGNKISLFGYSTDDAKTHVLAKIATLLQSPGWMLEASGAVSWVLRSKYHLKPITSNDMIERLLDIHLINSNAYIEEQIIIMNPNYQYNDRNSQVYEHVFLNRLTNEILFSNQESLFAHECITWSESSCGRTCNRS